MDDENKQEDVVQEPPKPSPMVEAAQLAAENLIKENERLEKNLSRLEALQAERALGGRADAGEEPAKEESNEDYAKRVLSGNV